MPGLLAKLSGFFRSRTLAGFDKIGNRYFTRTEDVDGILKEKRWVVFKGEQDPTFLPVEWICWLNGQRKRAPTAEEITKLEAKRELVKQNVALLKKEEAEKKLINSSHGAPSPSKVTSPDLKSFIRQIPGTSFNVIRGSGEASDSTGEDRNRERMSEPTGSGASFKPGTWQPPT